MTLRGLLLAASLGAAPAVACGQTTSGLYIGAGAMANFMQSETLDGIEGPAPTNPGHGSRFVFDPGWGGVAAIGYGLGNGIRLELEANYRSNTLQAFHGATAAGHPRGAEDNFGVMTNALFDLRFSDLGLPALGIYGFNPYVGAGVGYNRSRWGAVSVPLETGSNYSSLNVDAGADRFAVQAIFGVAAPLYLWVPGLSLTAEYRLFVIPEDRKYGSQLAARGAASASSVKLGDAFNHSIVVGLRYEFGRPTPQPLPPPAPIEAPDP